MDDMSLQVAQRIMSEARQKVAMAASVLNDARNMVKAVNAAGYNPRQMAQLMPVLDEAVNNTELSITMIDRAKG